MTAKFRGAGGRLVMAALAAAAAFFSPAPGSAQTCGTDYVLKAGDTLAEIARTVYGSTSQWSIIYYANQDRLGENTTLLVPGLAIKIPCIGPQPNKPAAPIVTESERSILPPSGE
ncbi:MAG TPA: hypothetical protein VH858_09555, partial [Hyphomicrobiales bacterium]